MRFEPGDLVTLRREMYDPSGISFSSSEGMYSTRPHFINAVPVNSLFVDEVALVVCVDSGFQPCVYVVGPRGAIGWMFTAVLCGVE